MGEPSGSDRSGSDEGTTRPPVSNDATIALSDSELLALEVKAGPPALPAEARTPRPAPAPIPRNDASMWAGRVMESDDFAPVATRRRMWPWVGLGVVAAGLFGGLYYWAWWPASDGAGATAASPAEARPDPQQGAPAAAPAPAPAALPPSPPSPPPPAPPPASAPVPARTVAPAASTTGKTTGTKRSTHHKPVRKRHKRRPPG